MLKRDFCDEAEICRAGNCFERFGFKFFAHFMQVNFLSAKLSRFATGPECHDLHSQDTRVELARGVNALYCEDEMVDVINMHTDLPP
jgi:hypothetical protein